MGYEFHEGFAWNVSVYKKILKFVGRPELAYLVEPAARAIALFV